jgi:pyridoxamine 5'-phosphate oxidase
VSERYEYTRASLSEAELDASPFALMRRWISEAMEELIVEPTAACLSTVSAEGRPSSRMVLLRGIDDAGITFFTNYLSRKGQELAAKPVACLNLWWAGPERQIRIEGQVAPVAADISDDYWRERPRDSQLASAASPQSTAIPDRDVLFEKVTELAERYPDAVPRPENWGGYRLEPDYFEFWQGGVSRLHDRFEYRLCEGTWKIQRLAP